MSRMSRSELLGTLRGLAIGFWMSYRAVEQMCLDHVIVGVASAAIGALSVMELVLSSPPPGRRFATRSAAVSARFRAFSGSPSRCSPTACTWASRFPTNVGHRRRRVGPRCARTRRCSSPPMSASRNAKAPVERAVHLELECTRHLR